MYIYNLAELKYYQGKEEGQKEIWDLARKLVLNPEDGGFSIDEIREIFDDLTTAAAYDIFKFYKNHYEMILKVKEHEKKNYKPKLNPGNEICRKDNEDCCVVITALMTGDMADCIGPYGEHYQVKLSEWKRTGRYFPQILEILEGMRGK